MRESVFDHIVDILSDLDEKGGATINDLAKVGRSPAQIRRYLCELEAEGIIARSQPMGPGTRWRLCHTKRRRIIVTLTEGSRKLSQVEVPQELLFGVAGDRKLLRFAREVLANSGIELGSDVYSRRRS